MPFANATCMCAKGHFFFSKPCTVNMHIPAWQFLCALLITVIHSFTHQGRPSSGFPLAFNTQGSNPHCCSVQVGKIKKYSSSPWTSFGASSLWQWWGSSRGERKRKCNWGPQGLSTRPPGDPHQQSCPLSHGHGRHGHHGHVPDFWKWPWNGIEITDYKSWIGQNTNQFKLSLKFERRVQSAIIEPNTNQS